MTDDFVLREFVCKHCGHKIVVNPKLPKDYEPNICSQCWDKFERPRHEKAMAGIFVGLNRLLSMLGVEDKK